MANHNVRKTNAELRKFGLTIGLVFALIAAFLWWKGRPAFTVVASVSTFFLLTGFVVPMVLRPIEIVWMKIAEGLAFVSTRVILTLAFYLVILPFGLVLRIFRKDLLGLKIDRAAESYWSAVEEGGPSTRADKPY